MNRIKKNWSDEKVSQKVDEILQPFDDGELFAEEVFSENIVYDDNKIKNASFDQDKGFGLRAVRNEELRFFHSNNFEQKTFDKALDYINKFDPKSASLNTQTPPRTNISLYEDKNPINSVSLEKKNSATGGN